MEISEPGTKEDQQRNDSVKDLLEELTSQTEVYGVALSKNCKDLAIL